MRSIQAMCSEGEILGASKMSNVWVIPEDAVYPIDGRVKSGNYVDWRRKEKIIYEEEYMGDVEKLGQKIIQQTDTMNEEGLNDSGEILEILLNTREQGQMMEQLIKNQIEVKDSMIDKLYKELDYYKQDYAGRFVEQLMKSVIKVRKDMYRMRTSDKWEELSVDDIKREYQYILEDITDLLEQHNVDFYQTEQGSEFDASIHQPKLESTNDETLDKKIKESISEGYKKGDKVLIPERVIVYQYKK